MDAALAEQGHNPLPRIVARRRCTEAGGPRRRDRGEPGGGLRLDLDGPRRRPHLRPATHCRSSSRTSCPSARGALAAGALAGRRSLGCSGGRSRGSCRAVASGWSGRSAGGRRLVLLLAAAAGDRRDREVAIRDRRLDAFRQLRRPKYGSSGRSRGLSGRPRRTPGCRRPGTTTSTSWRTTLSTPPRFRPGDSASLMKRTGTPTRTRLSAPMRWKSTWSGRSLTGSSWTSRGIALSVLPSTSISKTVDRNRPFLMSLNRSLASIWMVSAALSSPP